MEPPAATQDDRELTEVVRSARGWNGVQLAALAFIGLCGVLSDADAATPRWVQITAGVLALLALVLACASIFLVATVAWPFPSSPGGAPDRVDAAAVRRLRHGVRLTFVAVAVMALAASGSWWPTAEVDRARRRDRRVRRADHRWQRPDGVRRGGRWSRRRDPPPHGGRRGGARNRPGGRHRPGRRLLTPNSYRAVPARP